MNAEDDQITMYSDYVCPFCYLGRRALGAYQQTRDRRLAIDWRPFDLRSHKRGPDGEIDPGVPDGKDDAYFEQVRRNVDRLKSRYDAEEMVALDALPGDVDSFDAQAASYYVRTEYPDRWRAFDEAIFEALWLDGQDIGTVEILTTLADQVGLERDEIRAAVRDETRRDALRETFAEAQREGVTAVPTFRYGSHSARGAVPPEQLRRLVEGT